jgi:hypothetical protein
MDKGIIYYNSGTGCLPRLTVSLYSLRKHYDGPVTVISDGSESSVLCKKLQADPRLNISILEPHIDVRKGKNHHYLAKCRLHEVTPYDPSLFIDSDTIIVGDLTPLFAIAQEHEFAVPRFANWITTGRMISKRILEWKDIRPRDMKQAISFGPAVNTGVMAFRRDSKFMKDWFRVARRGRSFFIPDETSCQVILWRYPHKVVEAFYNASCRTDECKNPNARLIHFHGRKHCRVGFPFNANLWIDAYREVCDLNIGEIQSWTPAGDRHLRRYLASIKENS